jgi:hypothetical protein
MIDWIQKNINPPGINKPNRLALFSTVGEVAGKVRADALKAFNAHFPYLADPEKLKEHADSLLIPDIPYDTEEELRDRVSTASFFLMRAGERGYILEQLKAHFGDRFIVKDEFLNLYIKVLDLEEKDRAWALNFLDRILDPNIALTVSEWFHFVETVTVQDNRRTVVTRNDIDVFGNGLCCDGRFYCDQAADILCDGEWLCDGSRDCEGFLPVRGTISDTILIETDCSGVWSCNGECDCSGYAEIYSPLRIEGIPLFDCQEDEFETTLSLEPLADSAVIDAVCDGSLVCDGRNIDAIIDAPMTMRVIRPFFCDGSKTVYTTTLDGAVICDGSFVCAEDGQPCSDLIEEEYW